MSEHIVFNGVKYFKDSNGYWHSTTSPTKLLHIEVWKATNGEIPSGHHIHHIDFNPSNNSLENLQCLTRSEHARIHNLSRLAAGEHFKTKTTRDIPTICIQCGKNFLAVHKNAKFCSRSCAGRWRRAHAKDITRTCAVCGKDFLTKPERRTRYCSKVCAAISHKKNKLTLEQRDEIKRLYVKGSKEFGARALAKRFNVTHSAILYIVKGK